MRLVARNRTVWLSAFAALVLIIAVAYYALHLIVYKVVETNQQYGQLFFTPLYLDCLWGKPFAQTSP